MQQIALWLLRRLYNFTVSHLVDFCQNLVAFQVSIEPSAKERGLTGISIALREQHLAHNGQFVPKVSQLYIWKGGHFEKHSNSQLNTPNIDNANSTLANHMQNRHYNYPTEN